MKKQIINISFNSKVNTDDLNLEKRLSNLYPYKFTMDDATFESWEGFIQSLKTPNPDKKAELWKLHGYWAWKNGQGINWWDEQTLYWKHPIKRESKEYTELITRSYDMLFEQNEDFRKALEESLPYKLDHSKGKTNKTQTLLTKKEYIYQMERLRKKLKPQRFFNIMDMFKIT